MWKVKISQLIYPTRQKIVFAVGFPQQPWGSRLNMEQFFFYSHFCKLCLSVGKENIMRGANFAELEEKKEK